MRFKSAILLLCMVGIEAPAVAASQWYMVTPATSNPQAVQMADASSIRGDKMQIAGMRVVPSPRITLVPIGVKLIGIKESPPLKAIIVPEASSYLAVSKL